MSAQLNAFKFFGRTKYTRCALLASPQWYNLRRIRSNVTLIFSIALVVCLKKRRYGVTTVGPLTFWSHASAVVAFGFAHGRVFLGRFAVLLAVQVGTHQRKRTGRAEVTVKSSGDKKCEALTDYNSTTWYFGGKPLSQQSEQCAATVQTEYW